MSAFSSSWLAGWLAAFSAGAGWALIVASCCCLLLLLSLASAGSFALTPDTHIMTLPSCLNLIDTPGHVDFSYEVSRSLAACEGALLVVDASQGIEAQTLANVYLALENNLEIIPVLNKIDLPAADPDRVATEIEQTIGLDCTDIVKCSAKSGIGIQQILERIVKVVPPPPAATNGGPFRALIFDSYYDTYRGIVVFFRVVDGQLTTGDKVRFLASAAEHEVTELGIMQPNEVPVDTLRAGEVGYLWGSIKDVLDARVGDTITLAAEYKKRRAERAEGSMSSSQPAIEPLPGYAKSTPMVYCGLFPVDAEEYEGLRDALGKLTLNDASLSYEPESSGAMGFGFRCGFLGLLHMEIIQERLSREYDIDLIVTAPSVVYKVRPDGDASKEITVDAPSKMPDLGRTDEALEPYVKMEILTPSEYNGAIIELAQDRRGVLVDIKFLTPTRSTIIYELPLAEVITDFFDVLKSATKGYGTCSGLVGGYCWHPRFAVAVLCLAICCSSPPPPQLIHTFGLKLFLSLLVFSVHGVQRYRLPSVRPGTHGCKNQLRRRSAAGMHYPPGQGPSIGSEAVCRVEGAHSKTNVQDPHSSVHRRQGDCLGVDQPDAQGWCVWCCVFFVLGAFLY
jgi:elongation factor 4